MTDIIQGAPTSASQGASRSAAQSTAVQAPLVPTPLPPTPLPPKLVAPPQFAESALLKPRPSAQQIAMQVLATPSPAAQALAAVGSSPLGSASGPSPFVPAALVPSLFVPAPSAAPSLRTRVAAFEVMAQCLRVQSVAPERSRFARLLGREPLHPDARSWYRGAIGELEVARILARLDRRWTVLHAVPVGSAGADIDHVVIGPAGTFTINTKNHSGKKIWTAGTTFMVNRLKLGHIHNSTFEAQRAARLLSDVAATPVAVTPLIVVVSPESLTRKKPDVTVMESADLYRWLKRQPQMQTDATVARIAWAAERRETWTTLASDERAGDERVGDERVGDERAGDGHNSRGMATVTPIFGRAEPTSRDNTNRGPARTKSASPESASPDAASPDAALSGAAPSDAATVERRFAALRAEVETAESRRQAWSLLGAAAFLAAVVASAMLIAPAVPAIVSELLSL